MQSTQVSIFQYVKWTSNYPPAYSSIAFRTWFTMILFSVKRKLRQASFLPDKWVTVLIMCSWRTEHPHASSELESLLRAGHQPWICLLPHPCSLLRRFSMTELELSQFISALLPPSLEFWTPVQKLELNKNTEKWPHISTPLSPHPGSLVFTISWISRLLRSF